MPRPRPRPTRSPYTTLFRSNPHIDTYIGANAKVTAGGAVTIESLHDVTPGGMAHAGATAPGGGAVLVNGAVATATAAADRSEEHTSELQSRGHLVCRLLPEK